MSFFKDILSRTENIEDCQCSIPMRVRFIWALSILAVALLTSICIKSFRDEDVEAISDQIEPEVYVSSSENLVSIPKDFTLRSQEDMMRLEELARFNRIKYSSAKPTGNVLRSVESFPSMDATYDEANTVPKLSTQVNSSKSTTASSKEMQLRNGYIRYRTVNGDKLDDLAQRFLGDSERWPEIYDLNREVLTNKNVIPIGIILFIPPKEKQQGK